MTQRFRDTGRRQPHCSGWFSLVSCDAPVETQGGAVQPQNTPRPKRKKGGKTEAGRGDSTETKLGPSEMKEKKEVGGKTERLKERGSVQVMDTQRQREKQRERERTCPQRI